jgi:hypothetical protein
VETLPCQKAAGAGKEGYSKQHPNGSYCSLRCLLLSVLV